MFKWKINSSSFIFLEDDGIDYGADHFCASMFCSLSAATNKKHTVNPLPIPLSYRSYLWAAVRSSRAAVKVVLGQEEGRVCHVQNGVVNQYHFTEVKLVGEPFPFGFVQNALVIVIPAEEERDGERISMQGWMERWKRIKEKGKGEGRIILMLASRFCVSSL